MKKKKLVQVWVTEEAYCKAKSQAALEGVKFYEFFEKKLRDEAEREENTLRRRYYPKF